MKHLFLCLVYGLFLSCSQQKNKLDNVIYPFNNAMTSLPNVPEGFDDQAKLIKKIGFNALGGHTRDDYFKRRSALNKYGLTMPELYWGITLDSLGNYSYDTQIEGIIRDSKDNNLIVSLFVVSKAYKDNRKEGDPILIKGIQELADFAAPFNVKIAIYPHVNLYVEEVGHSVKLAQMANRKNVGAIFNTCHFLKKEGEEGWQQKLKNAVPYLFMVSLSGADAGDTQEMPMSKLIKPLGEGTFDTYKIVKFLKDNNYNGPFGLQCYMIKQDCEVVLTKSLNTWRDYQKRYSNEAL
ncbi:MAG: sugar phosphate isomerase/epimerase [Reichenbachiella sp.]